MYRPSFSTVSTLMFRVYFKPIYWSYSLSDIDDYLYFHSDLDWIATLAAPTVDQHLEFQ
jgi:hypothetical protein